jgi:hypothetical protein
MSYTWVVYLEKFFLHIDLRNLKKKNKVIFWTGTDIFLKNKLDIQKKVDETQEEINLSEIY